MGDHVEAGQLLAEIESPELAAQLKQAQAVLDQAIAARNLMEANLAQAQANLDLSKVTLERFTALSEKGLLSMQDLSVKQSENDVQKAAVAAARANVSNADANIKSNEANVQRLNELMSYLRLTAPYAGIITARNVEVGTLIGSGSSTTTRELFRMMKPETVRILVGVPQTFVRSVHEDQLVAVSVQEFPGLSFTGHVAFIANSLDPATHTMQTEVHIDNNNLKLLPGMYANVKFVMDQTNPAVLMPSDALIVRSEGPLVATVGSDQKVHILKLELGRDFGAEIEVVSGIRENVTVILNPAEDLTEDMNVTVLPARTK
jgi:RND family efflux transporter MFP subunit